MAATGPSSSSNPVVNSQSVKQESQPQDVVKTEIVDPKEEPKEVKMEPKEESKEGIKIEPIQEPVDEPINIMDNKEQTQKFKKYEADFKQYLMSKYFSDKTVFGGNIFDVKMNIEGQNITASRSPPYESFLDPVKFQQLIAKDAGPSGEPQGTSNSNGKPSN